MFSLYLKLVVKEIFRHKVRSFLTLTIIVMAVMSYVVVDSVYKGVEDAWVRAVINFYFADIHISSDKYNEKELDFEGLLETTNYIEKLENIGIKDYTYRLLLPVEVDNGETLIYSTAFGVDPDEDKKVYALLSFSSKPLSNGYVIVGKDLAKKLNVSIGDTIFLNFLDANGVYNGLELEVLDIISADPQIDKGVIVDIKDFWAILGKPYHSFLAIRLKNKNEASTEKEKIGKILGTNFSVKTWRELVSMIYTAAESKLVYWNTLIFFILLIAIVGITNTLLIVIYERFREFGIMKALGFTDKEIFYLILLEGVGFGVIGGILGIFIAIIIIWYLNTYGMQFLPTEIFKDYGISVGEIIKAKWNFQTMLIAFVLASISGFIAGIYPARKVQKFEAVECLKVM